MSSGNDMAMVGAAIDGMQLPATELAMVRDGAVGDSPLVGGKDIGVLGLQHLGFEEPDWIGELPSAPVFNPPSFIAGEPSTGMRLYEEKRNRVGQQLVATILGHRMKS
jgi:hypothetical protein